MKRLVKIVLSALCWSLLVTLSAPTSSPAGGPPSGLDVKVINTPLPVSITGTPNVNVIGAVTTQAALPDHSFSVTHTTTSATPALVGVDCEAGIPAGTRWVISSFTIANNSSTISGLFRLVLFNHTTSTLELGGPAIRANPGETVQLTFPQPYVLSSPGVEICLGADTATDVYVSVVGFRQ